MLRKMLALSTLLLLCACSDPSTSAPRSGAGAMTSAEYAEWHSLLDALGIHYPDAAAILRRDPRLTGEAQSLDLSGNQYVDVREFISRNRRKL